MRPLDVDEPTVVGPYRLLGRLGSGGMGRVYLGRSAGGRTVAVKIVHPHFALDEEFRVRFRREVEAARRVGGAWTAPVLDADPDARVPWVATAYAAGPSLTAAVADGGPLPAHTVRALGAGLGEALAAVHELGLVHRDVKPSNVLLTLDGPLLIDFGIARATGGTASLTSTGVSIGSPGYMSPEQILGKGVTGAADVFSLGAVLAFAATGRPPFPGDSSAALLYKVVHEEPELDALDGELGVLVRQCLAKEPGARPAPGEVARRLAPDGAARLVAGGWLPGALVEQVSRSAVRLLNLEAAAGEGGPESGPVGFSRSSVTAGAEAAGTETAGTETEGTETAGGEGPDAPTAGAFGPPPVMPGPPAHPEAPAHLGALASLGAPTPLGASAPLGAPTPSDAVSGQRDGGRGPGKFSVHVAAASTRGGDGRGRRLSCTVALAVAGALAAVTVGSAFLFDLLPDDRRDAADGGTGRETHWPSASDGARNTVPDAYLGTWEGQGTALGGTLPAGTFRVTIARVGVGQELGRLRQTDQLGGSCVDVLTLKQVTDRQIVAASVGAEGNHDGCNQSPTTVRFTPVGDDLAYASESAESGKPQARLSKVG
ncbi:serine/threonine-protein kinase [Streptomyces sp. JHA26]|uniref:serine/threonine-protein kinase n=1 Tax=Streptomyces sp. JHA26 TaxID=1917143 RepID=UPI00098B6924|nr:serine/threonine-protein kinase [Streptomyces sp. JHA26]